METWRHKESHRIHLNTAANLSNIPGPRLILWARGASAPVGNGIFPIVAVYSNNRRKTEKL